MSVLCYPAVLPFAAGCHSPLNETNAVWWRATFMIMLFGGSGFLHGSVLKRCTDAGLSLMAWQHVLGHAFVFCFWDDPFLWFSWVSHKLIGILRVDRRQNRLNAGKLYGPRIMVIGNGPSAVEGEPFGSEIDKFDEVVRFNNFVCKSLGMEKWVGTKTTVHFSDGVLYPTFTDYHVPGATVVLSLFADRLMIAGSYLLQRAGADLQWQLAWNFMFDPETTWIEKERIERLKGMLGCKGPKHPTSGMLAIDYFVHHPNTKLPVVIHGFDFFQGPKIHYYAEVEPWFERFNNHIGVNMHSPHLEKILVQKWVEEGKVIFLEDWVKQGRP